MPHPPLPSPLSFLSTLLTQISHPESNAPPTPLLSRTQPSKSLLLTLHCLFPNELLPALDLLDRRFVTRFVWGFGDGEVEEEGKEKERKGEEGKREVYYVRSSAAPSSRWKRGGGGTTEGGKVYEVRLRAWNCTCPAFGFAAFADNVSTREFVRDEVELDGGSKDDDEEGEGGLGGLRVGRQEDVPICKHLLACVLAEGGGVFGEGMEERDVGKGEMGGWAAGWGG